MRLAVLCRPLCCVGLWTLGGAPVAYAQHAATLAPTAQAQALPAPARGPVARPAVHQTVPEAAQRIPARSAVPLAAAPLARPGSLSQTIPAAVTDTVRALAPADRSGGQEGISVPFGGLTKEVEVELYGTTRTASPGGLVLVRYTVNSYEDQDERVRLRLLLPAGWTLQDHDVDGREIRLESWESVEGEVRVTVPAGARPGERHVVRMVAEVVGEPGGAAVFSTVQIARRGGLKAGQVGLTGTASALATNVALDGPASARYGGMVDLSGTVARQTTLSLAVRQGARETALTNFRIAQDETRWSGTLRGPGWLALFGNQVTSGGTVLTGPSVRGRGITARRTEGRIAGDLTIAQPTVYAGPAAGHLVRGSVGVSGPRGRAAVAVSDFGRPGGGYSLTPVYAETIDPEEVEWLERERQAAERAQRTRVQGAGLDLELQHATRHRLTVRGGWLRLASAAGETAVAPSAEAQYAYTHRRASASARWRQMPASLDGLFLPGDETALDGSVTVVGAWALTGRAYRTLSDTRGSTYRSEGEGASLGVRYAAGAWRLDARGGHRAWSYGATPTTARTVTLSVGAPVGPLVFSGSADVGEQDNGTVRQPTQSYRGDLRWTGRVGTASGSASYFETLSAPPRLRTDLLGSLKLGAWEMAGGAWATHGLTQGGQPGFWTQVGMPAPHDLTVSVGVEHAPASWGQPPSWMGTLGVRTNVAVALPFLRAAD